MLVFTSPALCTAPPHLQAIIGFAGRRVIEQTLQEQLPDDFQVRDCVYLRVYACGLCVRRSAARARGAHHEA